MFQHAKEDENGNNTQQALLRNILLLPCKVVFTIYMCTVSGVLEYYNYRVHRYQARVQHFYQLAARVQPAGPKITLRFPRLLVCIFVRPYLSRAQLLRHVHCCHATLL